MRMGSRTISNKETPILIEGAPFLGHVTNTRLIIEPRKVDSLSMVLGASGPKFLERIVLVWISQVAYATSKGGKKKR